MKMKALLGLETKQKRGVQFSVRLTESATSKIKALSKLYKVSQADLLIHLVENAYSEHTASKK